MYIKLALRNAKRSAKGYLIYIVTLTICVTLFYAFLSISSSFYKPDIGQEFNIKTLGNLMKVAILLITLLLIFLVQYVNRFMFYRRQKEFAIQCIMGMAQGFLDKRTPYDIQMYSGYAKVENIENLPQSDYRFLDAFLKEHGIVAADSCSFRTHFLNKANFYNGTAADRTDAPITAISLSSFNKLLTMLIIRAPTVLRVVVIKQSFEFFRCGVG